MVLIWGDILSVVLEVWGLGFILFDNYIDGLDKGVKIMFIKFVIGIKLGGVVIFL